jgi:hypothetical protein
MNMATIEISEPHEPALDSPPDTNRTAVAPNSELDADAYEDRIRAEKTAQFNRLKDGSRAIFGQVQGRPGVYSPEKWAQMLEKAGDDIGNGRFIVRQLGAERYLDPETVAVLITLRQNLLADIPKVTTVDIMMVDAAVIAYYNMLRTQGWIGNLSLVVERELFGQAPLNEIHGPQIGEEIKKDLRHLAETMLPLQDRAHKMMIRSLAALGAVGSKRKN